MQHIKNSPKTSKTALHNKTKVLIQKFLETLFNKHYSIESDFETSLKLLIN
jgi:hypothetical protein